MFKKSLTGVVRMRIFSGFTGPPLLLRTMSIVLSLSIIEYTGFTLNSSTPFYGKASTGRTLAAHTAEAYLYMSLFEHLIFIACFLPVLFVSFSTLSELYH